MVVRDIERDEIEFISETLNCLPISHVDHMRPDKLGHADLVESENVSHSRAEAPAGWGLTWPMTTIPGDVSGPSIPALALGSHFGVSHRTHACARVKDRP